MTATQFALLGVAVIALGGAIDQLRRHDRFMRVMKEMSRLSEIAEKSGDLEAVRPAIVQLMEQADGLTDLDRRAGVVWTIVLLAFGALLVGAMLDLF